ncbi:MAG: hypothetical protein ACO1OK_04490 [Devosia sp.]
MPETSPLPAPSTGRLLAGALPAILLILVYLWLADGVLAWMLASSLGHLVGNASLLLWGFGIVLAIPALWLSWQLCRVAVEGEREAIQSMRSGERA